MLIRILKTDHYSNFFILFFTTILLWTSAWLDPIEFYFFPGEASMPLYHPIDNLFLGTTSLVVAIAGAIMTLINALFIYLLNSKFLFMKTRTYLPSFLYIVFTSSVKEYNTLLPSQFATFIIIIGIYYIFKTYQSEGAIGYILKASILLSLASLFYLPAILFLPIIWISILVLRQKFNWRHLAIPIIGVIIPWYICVSIYYLQDNLYSLKNILRLNTLSTNIFLSHKAIIFQQGFIIALFVIWGILSVIRRYGLKKEASRKYLNILIWMILCSISIFLLVPTCSYELITIAAIPLSYLTAHIFQFNTSSFWYNILFALFVATIVASPYFHVITL
ncbi:hypothetical protein K4L44_14430 [Halosquirtibacter laminarini]|uniref:Uncharacterized protein n=1 Tax=Halosquirtibacter laminarini TaxID=3374600 RepID=A0AC61NN03_9BACT|nr:hypothetical protein K4L44_14430 [Prolixibacteraceae bacterium]